MSATTLRRMRSLEFILGAGLTGAMTLAVLLSGVLFAGGADAMDLAMRLTLPFQTLAHPLGTDPLGRDVLARTIVGGRVSLTVGVLSVAGAVVVGTLAGLIAGYYRGVWDGILMRWADVQLALPFILLAITFAAILGTDMWKLIAFMAIAQWVQYARVVRSATIVLREREFVISAHAVGVRDPAILFRHILPNALAPVLVLVTLNVANNILLESSLTFLGLGIDPLIPSWGGMLADGRTYLQTAWWVSVFPGLAIMLTVLGLNLLGDWFRDWSDPVTRSGV
jgi:peptide/nickel transport system permease protein